MTHKITIKYDQVEPSPKIVVFIMDKVNKYEKRRYVTRVTFHSLLTIGAGLALIPTVSSFISSVSDSGLMTYLSLISTDGMYIVNHSSDLLLSIGTSLPVMAIIILLSIAIVLTNSLRRIFQYSSILTTDYKLQLS